MRHRPRPAARSWCALSAALIAASLTARANAKDDKSDAAKGAVSEPAGTTPKGRWGDASFSLVERYGRLVVPSPELGTSGTLAGSGFELRFMMPVGWGAYYRWVNGATNARNGFDWFHGDFSFGIDRRLHATGGPSTWSVRTQSRFELGLAYTQLGTNLTCTRSASPLATSCDGGGIAGNVSGAGFGLETRIAAEIALGPIYVGADLGIAGYRRWSTGSASLSPPGWFALPSAQLRMGVGFSFD